MWGEAAWSAGKRSPSEMCIQRACETMHIRLSPASLSHPSTTPQRRSAICSILPQLIRAASLFRGPVPRTWAPPMSERQSSSILAISLSIYQSIYQMHEESRKVVAAPAACPNGPATAYMLPRLPHTLGAWLDLTEQDQEWRWTSASPPQTIPARLRQHLSYMMQ